jgi:hypothetical protein
MVSFYLATSNADEINRLEKVIKENNSRSTSQIKPSNAQLSHANPLNNDDAAASSDDGCRMNCVLF